MGPHPRPRVRVWAPRRSARPSHVACRCSFMACGLCRSELDRFLYILCTYRLRAFLLNEFENDPYMADGLLPDALRSSPCTLSAAFVSHEMGGISPSPQINTPGDRTPVAPVPQVCHRPGAVRACVQRAHGVADYHLFSIWRCWPFAALLANAHDRCVRCADREHHRESRPREERMRASTARRRGGVHERRGDAFARWRAVRHASRHR